MRTHWLVVIPVLFGCYACTAPPTESTHQVNRGFALLAEGELDGAYAEFHAVHDRFRAARPAIASDVHEYNRALLGMGIVEHRRGNRLPAARALDAAAIRHASQNWKLCSMADARAEASYITRRDLLGDSDPITSYVPQQPFRFQPSSLETEALLYRSIHNAAVRSFERARLRPSIDKTQEWHEQAATELSALWQECGVTAEPQRVFVLTHSVIRPEGWRVKQRANVQGPGIGFLRAIGGKDVEGMFVQPIETFSDLADPLGFGELCLQTLRQREYEVIRAEPTRFGDHEAFVVRWRTHGAKPWFVKTAYLHDGYVGVTLTYCLPDAVSFARHEAEFDALVASFRFGWQLVQ